MYDEILFSMVQSNRLKDQINDQQTYQALVSAFELLIFPAFNFDDKMVFFNKE